MIPLVAVLGGAVAGMPAAHADNKRLNDGVVANVYTIQHQHGCDNNVKINPKLQLAAQWHTDDVLNNRDSRRRHRLGRIDGGRRGPMPPATRASSPKPWRSTRRWRSTASRS